VTSTAKIEEEKFQIVFRELFPSIFRELFPAVDDENWTINIFFAFLFLLLLDSFYLTFFCHFSLLFEVCFYFLAIDISVLTYVEKVSTSISAANISHSFICHTQPSEAVHVFHLLSGHYRKLKKIFPV